MSASPRARERARLERDVELSAAHFDCARIRVHRARLQRHRERADDACGRELGDRDGALPSRERREPLLTA